MSIGKSDSEEQNFVTNCPAAEKARSASVDEVGKLCTTQNTFSIQAGCLPLLSNMFISFLICTKIPGDYVKWFLGNDDNSERETKGKGRKLCLLALELAKH